METVYINLSSENHRKLEKIGCTPKTFNDVISHLLEKVEDD